WQDVVCFPARHSVNIPLAPLAPAMTTVSADRERTRSPTEAEDVPEANPVPDPGFHLICTRASRVSAESIGACPPETYRNLRSRTFSSRKLFQAVRAHDAARLSLPAARTKSSSFWASCN